MITATVEKLEKKAAEEAVENAHRTFGLSYSEVASVLGVDRRTLLRYRRRLNVPSPKTRVSMEKIREIQYLLKEIFDGEEAAREWLYTPVSLLRDRRPIDLMRKGDINEVLAILAGLYSGAYI